MKYRHWIMKLLLTVCVLTSIFCFAGANAESLIAQGDCGDDVEWKLYDNGKLIILGEGAMWDFDSLSEPGYAGESFSNVEIGTGVTHIGSYAFHGRADLAGVKLSNTITSVGNLAFEGCTILQTVTIPDSVESIGTGVFRDCGKDLVDPFTIVCGCTSYMRKYADENGLSTFLRHNFVDGWCTICGEPEGCIAKGECGAEGDNVKWYLTEAGALYLRGTGAMANLWSRPPWYEYREGITSAEFIGEITKVGECTFLECSSLENVTLSDSVTCIAYMAFSDCSTLRALTLPKALTGIERCAFQNCSSLQTLTIPDSVVSIGEDAFFNCGTESENPFTIACGCNSAAHKYAINNAIQVLPTHHYADGFCTGCGEPENTIAKGGCGAEGDNVKWYLTEAGAMYIRGTGSMADYPLKDTPWINYCVNIASIEITSGVTNVGVYAFNDCFKVKRITIADSVEYIGSNAFFDCYNLTELILPNRLKGIEEYAFFSCASLITVTIPDSVEYIAKYAFGSCYDLETVTIPYSVESIGFEAFSLCRSVTINCGCMSYAKQYADENGIATSVQHVEIIDPCLPATRTLSGLTEGRHCDRCKEVLIPQEQIPAWTDIPVLELPNDVKTVGDEAFMASSIECAVIPDDCESIGSKAFANCASLKLAEIPASVTEIAADAFEDSPNVAILTTAGSPAEVYAKQNGLKYRILGK